ncbi:hypothetical protein B0T22DRAFT_98891 [Podospora appendiculata]|uniref:F-box domain-containing protein n=1 Tax=Podospora appendiculata TaxID=314037 RepID=A0AAE0XL57_9PEZI|nr:hypothetical protein B0T22DRAFT_98891 [Podospora appendiculata]
MDHPHITEFGSDRYLEKIARSQATGAQVASPPPPPPPVAAVTQSPFILPLRGSILSESEELVVKAGEARRVEKKGFLGFRKFHPKAASSAPGPESLERLPSHEPPARQSLPFDQHFQRLPNELQVEIIASLPLSDILNLRLASRSMHILVSLNEAPIARYHLDHHIPAYAKRLYPLKQGTPINFHYLCGIWHRLHVAAKLSYLMCEWISKELFLRNTEEKKREFAPQRERMRRRLIPLLFTIFHFFETYRDLHLKYLAENNGKGLAKEPYTVNPIETEIMNMYDDRTLLRVHEVFPLVISSFCRRLRPPSYVGRVERSLRGYLREKPPDEVHVAILCIGGLREVERIWEVKGYNTRRAAVDEWYNAITRDPIEPEPKKRRGMLGGLKRKKSSLAIGKGNTADLPPSNGRAVSEASTANGNAFHNFIFNTSLSAGVPMSPVPKEQLKTLLPDLPVLQKIWLETAEAMILERKIVERPSDIRRNAHIFTDLIREDGVEDEDQWWYGTVAPESVRPNLEAIEEDALE